MEDGNGRHYMTNVEPNINLNLLILLSFSSKTAKIIYF